MSERKLETPQHAGAEDRPFPVRHLLSGHQCRFCRRTRLLDEAEVGLGEGSEANV